MKSSDTRIAHNLRFLRMYSGMSQEQVADAITVSRNMYVRYESGASFPSVDKLQALSHLFKVSLVTLTERDLPSSHAQAAAGIVPKELRDILGVYENLSLLSRKVIMEEVRLLQELESRLYG